MWDVIFWVWIGLILPVMLLFMYTGWKDMKNNPDLDISTVLLGSALFSVFWPAVPFALLFDWIAQRRKKDKLTREQIRENIDVLEKRLKLGKYAK